MTEPPRPADRRYEGEEVLGRLRRAWSGLVSGYWFIPSAIVVATLVGALGLVALDAQLE